MAEESKPQCSSDDDKVYDSLSEFIQEQEELERDAIAVLGASDDSNCTYVQGYVKRQALYSCQTCRSEKPSCSSSGDGDGLAGICLACSLACHEGHNMYEIYTKRNFRCDCGNSKFSSSFKCRLQPQKAPANSLNKYDHNFSGLYCTCDRPYPDPDHEDDGEMLQCCLCEDWYHDNHLELSSPSPSDFHEMICPRCVRRHPFLHSYKSYSSADSPAADKEGSAQDGEKVVDVETTEEAEPSRVSAAGISDGSGGNSAASAPKRRCEKLGPGDDTTPRALFLREGWRAALCRCGDCTEYYVSNKIDFLLDEEDSTDAYERKAKTTADQTVAGSYEKAVDQFNSMDRVVQMEVLHGYNDMKENLSEYLKKFEQGKVVGAKDIWEFFDSYKKKKAKLTVPPSTCK